MSPGDDDLRSELERKALDFDPSEYWSVHNLRLSVIAFKAVAQAALTTFSSKPLYNVYEGQSMGRQLNETVDAFLKRLPPSTTPIHNNGPWIYIANPYAEHRPTDEHQGTLEERGKRLLDEFASVKADTETGMAGKAKSLIGRKITPLRRQLEKELFQVAKETGCTSGKWMMFPSVDDVNSFWSSIAEGTAAGELGHAAKVATNDGVNDRSERLICVYTADFNNVKDVKRVLGRLVDMGLVNRKGPMGEERGIYYKADVYTHLGINRDNEWGLKPSFYSSKELLATET